MLVVHWSPVKNTKVILRNGIRQSKNGLFCFPLTGHPNLDKWWANAFRQWRPRTAYNGFVFRIVEDDFPAVSHWMAQSKPLNSIKGLRARFESRLMFRIGERHFSYEGEAMLHRHYEFEQVGRALVAQNPEIYLDALKGDPRFLQFVFADYEIVLSRSIAPERIMRVITGSNQSGRNVARRKRKRLSIAVSRIAIDL